MSDLYSKGLGAALGVRTGNGAVLAKRETGRQRTSRDAPGLGAAAVCQQLLGILRQAVTPITDRGGILVASDSGIQTNTFNDLLRV